jgi:membrane-bound lytic murein transglycosylase A
MPNPIASLIGLPLVGGLFLAVTPPPIQPPIQSAPLPTVKPAVQPTIEPTVKPAKLPPKAPPPLAKTNPPQVGLDSQLFESGNRAALIQAIDHSLSYLQTPKAQKAYQNYPVAGVTRSRVERSLRRFRTLVKGAKTPEALSSDVQKEFQFYRSSGKDGAGTVHFTGYFEPVLTGSRQPSDDYRYPLYRLPNTFSTWNKPHPTRLKLEGANGLEADKGPLKGAQLVWVKDRLDAFLIQVQGSARLQLTDGTTMTIGYGGSTDYPYTGVGRELVKDGKFKLEDLTLPRLKQHFVTNPSDLDVYLPRNNRFVFFQNTNNQPPIGSLGLPVTAGRSIATDKRVMPPGAIALVQTQLPDDQLVQQRIDRYVLDQDTGSAIIGPGRVDVFMGSGDLAASQAGLVNATGQLYYLLLK